MQLVSGLVMRYVIRYEAFEVKRMDTYERKRNSRLPKDKL